MIDPARPAHPAGRLPVTFGSLGLSIVLMGMPLHVRAAPEPAPSPTAAPPPEATSAPDEGAAPQAEVAGDDDDGGEGAEVEDEDGSEGPEAEPEPETSPDAGALDDAPAADEGGDAREPAQAAAAGALGPTAAPLRPMQTAAWWTMFGAFAVGTTAGVLAGLAERQEDRATRLSTLFDAETGAQPLYADRKAEYERYLRRGEGYATAALGVGIVAGAATIAAITLFAIDARRQRGDATRKEPRRTSLRVSGGGMEVRF